MDNNTKLYTRVIACLGTELDSFIAKQEAEIVPNVMYIGERLFSQKISLSEYLDNLLHIASCIVLFSVSSFNIEKTRDLVRADFLADDANTIISVSVLVKLLDYIKDKYSTRYGEMLSDMIFNMNFLGWGLHHSTVEKLLGR